VSRRHERRARARSCLGDRLHRRVGAHHQDVGVAGEARRRAEPDELARIELDVGIVRDQSDQRHIAAEQTDCGAVLGRDRVEVVGGAQAAGARHVLHHDIGIARNVAAEIARQQARDDVVTAARPVADDQIDLLALVEIVDRRLGACGYGKDYCGDQQRRDEAYRDLAHGSLDLSCPGLTRASILLAKKMDCRVISASTRVRAMPGNDDGGQPIMRALTPHAATAPNRSRFVLCCSLRGGSLNKRAALPPRMLCLAFSDRNGRSQIRLGRSKSQWG